jgi:hypothetical protein
MNVPQIRLEPLLKADRGAPEGMTAGRVDTTIDHDAVNRHNAERLLKEFK